MPTESEDVDVGSLITTIPHLLAQYDARKKSLVTSSQDPVSLNADNDGLRRYRFIGRVISYDPETAVLVLEDHDADEGDLSCPPGSMRQIRVDADAVVFDDVRFTSACVAVGYWINVMGRLEVAENEELKVCATLIWACDVHSVQKVRKITRIIMKQQAYRKPD
ncbi:hypothetical protein V1506DRAFT_537638 [Lipomyces tetrasporus]